MFGEGRKNMIKLLTKMVDWISNIMCGKEKYPEIKQGNKGPNIASSVFPSTKIMEIAYKSL